MIVHSSLPSAIALSCLAMLSAPVATAHHSYAMFDLRETATVEGTVAKLEWKNPHTFVWIYVKNRDDNGYTLWGFENGPPGLLERGGWTRDSLKAGEKVTVQYFPLRDGGAGGHFVRAVHSDGSELAGDPYAPGVGKELAKGKLGGKVSP
jgi:hypothetical protein